MTPSQADPFGLYKTPTTSYTHPTRHAGRSLHALQGGDEPENALGGRFQDSGVDEGDRRIPLRTRLIAVAIVVAVVGALGTPAGAQQSAGEGGTGVLNVNLASMGVRTVLLVGPAVGANILDEALALEGDVGIQTVTGSYGVVVQEVTRTGTNGWYVTGRACADLACSDGNEDRLKSGSNELPGSAIDVTPESAEKVLLGGGDMVVGAGGSLQGAVELFKNTNQSPFVLYSGTYQGTGTIEVEPPEEAEFEAGLYTGFLVVSILV